MKVKSKKSTPKVFIAKALEILLRITCEQSADNSDAQRDEDAEKLITCLLLRASSETLGNSKNK